MTFKDLDDFLDSSLKLPYKGKVYEIPSPDADTGLWCQNLFSVFTTAASGGQVSDKFADRLKLDDDEELTLYQRVLSPAVYAEMIADKVPWDVLRHMAQTALIWIGADETRAEDFLEHRRPPKSGEEGAAGPQGFGEVGPTGLHRWYDVPGGSQAAGREEGHSWAAILRHWRYVEADLHETFGIDLDEPGLMQSRSWRWLKRRIEQLLTRPPSIVIGPNGKSLTIHGTRLALALDPPKSVDGG